MTDDQIAAGLQWWREQPDDRRLSLSSPNPMDGATDLTDEEKGEPIGHVRAAIIH
ncbi:hypothetical protein [Kineosporia sp. NBRC 101731]|uniref:hypothetical protein n=1 Tax=Kineosporia sp. NBRC 101731 TaxID=3032199 RepID=UPI0025579AC3|nr:hypothetical protein [Kineosporia sp. NBRC 101731]